jgi:uncharacterized protein (DUF433 family)
VANWKETNGWDATLPAPGRRLFHPSGSAQRPVDNCYADPMSSHLDRITVDPGVFGGRPCIRGLRIRVKDILDMLAGGASRAEILEGFPYLEEDDIAAALDYAAHHVDHPVIRPG